MIIVRKINTISLKVKKIILFCIVWVACLFFSALKAQDTTQTKVKISGYIQTQYQYVERDADGINFRLPRGANTYEQNFSRIGNRRGRLGFGADGKMVQGLFYANITENDISVIDVYVNVKDPWLGTNEFRIGLFERPFGHETPYSSSKLESPERARIIQMLFPDECDLGAMFTLQASKTFPWHILKFEGGWFSGNGVFRQVDGYQG